MLPRKLPGDEPQDLPEDEKLPMPEALNKPNPLRGYTTALEMRMKSLG